MKDCLKLFVCAACIVACRRLCLVGAERTSARRRLPCLPKRVRPRESPGESEAKELKNTLKWTTASEVENFGFDIYRSTSEDGTFERMTLEPLQGAGTIDEPQTYVWEDTTIEPGVDYYYYIESISYAGVRERFSPVIKSPAKN